MKPQERQQILDRDNHQCRQCGATGIPVHVHHLTYDADKLALEPGKYLIALCRKCHGKTQEWPKHHIHRESKMVVIKRRLYQAGGSVVITLPKEWLEKHGLKPGDEVGIVANSILKMIPMKEVE